MLGTCGSPHHHPGRSVEGLETRALHWGDWLCRTSEEQEQNKKHRAADVLSPQDTAVHFQRNKQIQTAVSTGQHLGNDQT
jgi:hypothetical protein